MLDASKSNTTFTKQVGWQLSRTLIKTLKSKVMTSRIFSTSTNPFSQKISFDPITKILPFQASL